MRPLDITWAGGEHPFLLTIELLRALQDKCDAGPGWILNRLTSGQWRVDDVIETIRLGLEGGGMKKADARKLVDAHVLERPLTLSVMTAQVVLMSALFGDPDDPVGEAPAGVETTTHSRAANGGSAGSTEPAKPSA